MTTFTEKDLIQYLYGECSKLKAKSIGLALQSNYELEEQYLELKAGMGQMDKLKLHTPRTAILNNIMDYAKRREVRNCTHPL